MEIVKKYAFSLENNLIKLANSSVRDKLSDLFMLPKLEIYSETMNNLKDSKRNFHNYRFIKLRDYASTMDSAHLRV